MHLGAVEHKSRRHWTAQPAEARQAAGPPSCSPLRHLNNVPSREKDIHGYCSTPRSRVALWLLQRYRVEFILLQRELRDVSALDFLHQLRSRSSTAALPVIVLNDADDVIIDRALRSAGRRWLCTTSATTIRS